MADVINITNRDSNLALQRKYSVNSPDYDNSDWIINPDLSGVTGIPEYYWAATGPGGYTGTVYEMDASQKASMDTSRLNSAKIKRSLYLRQRSTEFVEEQTYSQGEQRSLQNMFADGIRIRPNQQQYVKNWIEWIRQVDQNVADKINLVNSEISVTGVEGISLDENTLKAADPKVTVETGINIHDDLLLSTFLDENVAVTGMSGDTGIVGPYYLIELLNHRKELYNDNENPLYTVGHQPILGESGMLKESNNRILNLETIHNKGGFHYENVMKGRYQRPRDLLIYYGWLNSFNSATNQWNNENVAQDMSKYSLFVFGDGIQDPGHGDYSNTQVIISRIKELNPDALIFGYVSTNQILSTFKTKADQWDTLEVDGIFMDESGYDYGKTRSEFNERVDYVHGLSYSNVAFANAWNTDNILGTTNDPSYPNSTYNSSLAESNLSNTDWILMESWPINTTAYSGNDGYDTGSNWYLRGEKARDLRYEYMVNFASVGIISNSLTGGGPTGGQSLSNFGFVSSLMYSFEGFGTSDTSYGASSASVTYWARPDVFNMGVKYSYYPNPQQDNNDSDVYHRYVEFGKLSLDFSSSAQSATITKT